MALLLALALSGTVGQPHRRLEDPTELEEPTAREQALARQLALHVAQLAAAQDPVAALDTAASGSLSPFALIGGEWLPPSASPAPPPEQAPPTALLTPAPPAPALIGPDALTLQPLASYCAGTATLHRCPTRMDCIGVGMVCDERTSTCVCEPGACVDVLSGQCRALTDNTTVRARVWREPASHSSFPELADHGLEERTSNVGLALVGSGALALAVHAGVLRGLHALSMLPHLRYLSASGSGSIAAAAYAYADPQAVTSDVGLLGTFVPPEHLTDSELLDDTPTALVAGASADVWGAARTVLAEQLGPSARAVGVLGELWERTVARAFLEPLGLGRSEPFGWNEGALADFKARNARFCNLSAYLPRPLRPYVVLAAAIVGPTSELLGLDAGNGDGGEWPTWAEAASSWRPLHFTSVYTGVPATAHVSYERAPQKLVVDEAHSKGAPPPARPPLRLRTGGYIENPAIGGGAADPGSLLPTAKSTGLVSVPMPAQQLSLAKAVAACASRLSALMPAEAERRRQRELRAAQLESQRVPAMGENAAQWAQRLLHQGTAHLAYEAHSSTATWLDVLTASAPRLSYWSPANAQEPGKQRPSPTPPASIPSKLDSAEILLADANSPHSAIGALLLRGVCELIVPIVAGQPLSLHIEPGEPLDAHVDEQLLGLFQPTAQQQPAGSTGGAAGQAPLFERKGLPPLLYGLLEAKQRGRAVAFRLEHVTVANGLLGIGAGVRANVTWIYLERNLEWERRLGASADVLPQELLAKINQGNEADAEKQCARHPSGCDYLRFPNLRQTDLLPLSAQASAHELPAVISGAPSTRYTGLADEQTFISRADAAVLEATWSPLPRAVANAVAALMSFSVVSLEPTLYEHIHKMCSRRVQGSTRPSPRARRPRTTSPTTCIASAAAGGRTAPRARWSGWVATWTRWRRGSCRTTEAPG